MTIITTSRKPAPELRSLAKDLAFAAGFRYVIRGKMGLTEVRSIDSRIILFFQDAGFFQFQIIDDGCTAGWFQITEMKVGNRPETRMSGLAVTDQSVYEQLGPYVEVKLSEGDQGQCVFDGTRRRRYQLTLVSHGT